MSPRQVQSLNWPDKRVLNSFRLKLRLSESIIDIKVNNIFSDTVAR